MAKFSVNKKIDVDVEISVEEYYDKMSVSEENEMIDLLRTNDLCVPDLMNTIQDKAKFFKDLAYHIGVTDTEHIDALITELQYWSNK